jgi:type II secretory pathway predicted ATPase ExeA
MIEAYYHFKKTPFAKDIPPGDIFMSASGEELRQRLQYIKEKRGIMLITGDPGTGKTLQVRAFVCELNENHYRYFYIPLSTVNVLDFYRQLSYSLGGEPCYKKTQLFYSIQQCIKGYVENTKKIPVIIFDEAHLFINENFSELQIITNFSLDSVDPAVFLLVGQPHLRDRLLRPIHQSFHQRITLKFHLCTFTKEETMAYIEHHLRVAGVSENIFTPNALGALHQVSLGVARIINALAIKTLTIGALEKRDSLTEEEVYRASREL